MKKRAVIFLDPQGRVTYELGQIVIDDTSHAHEASLLVRCEECRCFGTPMPNDSRCGNCGSTDTVKYYPACCVRAGGK